MLQLNPELINELKAKIDIMLDHTQDTKFMAVLAEIKKLLLQTDNGKHKEPFVIAMRYIEKLPTSATPSLFFSTPTIGERIAKDKAQYTTTSDLLKDADKEIINFKISKLHKIKPTATQEKLLAGLQVNLMKIFKKPVAWQYDFPLDQESRQVMNDIVGHWQNDLMTQNKTKHDDALVDFSRGFTINGVGSDTYQKKGSTSVDKDLIKADIDKLLSPSNDQENNALYKEYISNMGGQANSSIMTELFLNNYFNKNPDELFSLMEVKVVDANWKMENGKPTLTCQYNINGIHDMLKDKLIYRSLNGRTIESDDKEELKLQTEKMQDITKEQPPLVKFDFKVELEAKDNKVFPKIVKLSVLSYTNRLQSPEQNLEKTLIDTPKPGR